MPRTKELSEDLRLRIVDLNKAGKGYKSISKSLAVHQSTVRQIVYKWRKFSTAATLPKSGRPVKMTARAQRRLLNEVKKNPSVSAKDLQKSLAYANNPVSESTIHKTLNKNGFHGRIPQRKPLLSKKKTLLHVYSLYKSTWMFHSSTGKIFCGQMKPELGCLEETHNTMCGEKEAQHTNIKTSSQL